MIKVEVKDGVIFKEFNEPLLSIIRAASICYANSGWTCTITSATDGTHKPNSLHYKNLALDFRTWSIPRSKLRDLASQLGHALGPEYQVVLETDHLHVEYDPGNQNN